MKLFKKQAFTLVELIVVITILAILGTVAFISLQGYTREARDSKRISDINNIQKKIGIEIVKGTSLPSLINLVKTNSGLTINSASGISIQGTANFQTLKEDGSKFKDPITGRDYVLSYSVGGTGTGAYKFTQVSTINEENNQAVVKGNYYQMKSGDSIGIIKNGANNFVIDEGSDLPYQLVANSCSTEPAYIDAIFTLGEPTEENQAWQGTNSTEACYYTCGIGKVLDGNICVSEICAGTTPDGTIKVSNATSFAGGTWNYNPAGAKCSYTCGIGYHTEDEGATCISNTTSSQSCINLPQNAKYYNETISYQITQTWSGVWGPTINAIEAGYNVIPTNNTCQWKCNTNYTQNGNTCILTITGNDTTGRTWSDGTYGASCNSYKNPSAGKLYSGSIGDGVYWVKPNANPAFKAYCDMTTDDGGWILVLSAGGTNVVPVSTTGEYNKSYLTGLSNMGAKFSDNDINALYSSQMRITSNTSGYTSRKVYGILVSGKVWEYTPAWHQTEHIKASLTYSSSGSYTLGQGLFTENYYFSFTHWAPMDVWLNYGGTTRLYDSPCCVIKPNILLWMK